VLLLVVALPVTGSTDPDVRRVLRLDGAGSLQIVLCGDTAGRSETSRCCRWPVWPRSNSTSTR
jgi:hypothetical protein